jgi:ribonuclease P protein component
MTRTTRLSRKDEFAAVYSEGQSWTNDLVALRVLPNSLGASRCGFAVGKRLGGAVVRNRLRRRLREIVRQLPISEGWDIVIIARQDAVVADYGTLRQATEELLYRAQLLNNGRGEA